MSDSLRDGRKGYFWAADDIFDVEGLDSCMKLIYLYLCSCVNAGIFPSNEIISKKCGISVDSTRQVIENLASCGLLIKFPSGEYELKELNCRN